MSKSIGLLVLLLIAPGTWVDQSPGGPALNDISFVDSMVGYAAGASGTIHRTVDGATWNPLSSGTTNALNAIGFATIDLGCAAGDGRTLLRTTDGSTAGTWANTVTGDLFAVGGSSATAAQAVGANGANRRTADGGTTWPLGDPNNTSNIRAVRFFSGTAGYAVGDAGRVRFWDGVNWTIPGGGTVGAVATLRGVAPATAAIAWAVGDGGTIRKTVNSGANWTNQDQGGGGQAWNAVYAGDTNNAWAVGAGGQIVHTDNGGANWPTQTSSVPDALHGVSFFNNGGTWVGVAVGANGTVISTPDGGQNWMAGASGVTVTLRAVHMLNATDAVAVGDGGTLVRSTDGGQNWNTVGIGATIENLFGVSFGSAMDGWAVGANGVVLDTADGGNSWTFAAGGTNQNLNDVRWGDATTAIAVGAGGEILKTTNAGLAWRRKTNGVNNWTTQALHGVAFGTVSRAVAVGANGTLLRTDNGGDAWASIPSGTTNPFFAVAAINETEFVAAGGPAGQGVVVTISYSLATSTWSASPLVMVGTAPVRGISFPRYSPRGYCVSDAGAVYTTTTAGDSWTAEASGTPENLKGVSFPCHSAGWVAGENGTIRKREEPSPLLSFPPHIGTPYTYQPPLIDGFVNPELTEGRRPDTGWDRALRVTYGDGTTQPSLCFQGLRRNSGNYVYLSFEVRNDTSFDDDETIVILLRDGNPAGPRPEHTAGDRRIIIRPLSTGSGSPAGPIVAPGYIAPAYTNNENGAPRTLDLYRWNAGAWQSIAASPELVVKVRSYTPVAGNFCWSVEVQVPTTNAVFADWINLQPDFLFSFYVLRQEAGGITEFSWPRDLYLAGPADVFTASMPACDWGTAKLGTAADTVGLHVKLPQYQNLGANTTGNPADPLTSQINGTSTNTFVARVVNDATTPANNVTATFRIADWGVQSGDPSSGAWRIVRTDVGHNNPTLPQTISAGGEVNFTFNWTLNSTEQTDYSPPHQHQCVQVSLDSNSSVIFSERSYWKNMNYVAASTFERTAFVSGKGYGRYGAKNGAQRFFLHVVSSKFDFDPKKDQVEVVPPPDPRQDPRSERKDSHPHYDGENLRRARVVDHYPGLKGEKGAVSHYTWEVHAVRETAGTVKIGSKVYPILQSVGGFGYVARHGNPVSEWTHGLDGAEVKKLSEHLYQVDVPVNGSVKLGTKLEAREGGDVCGAGGLGMVLAIGLVLLIIFFLLKKKP